MREQPFRFTDDRRRRAKVLCERCETPILAIVPLLHLVQEQEGRVSMSAARAVADELGMSFGEVYEVVRFHASFCEIPEAVHRIRVCAGPCCRLKGACELEAHLEQRLGIRVGQATEDGCFSLASVPCLGACDGAPAVMVGDVCYERMSVDKLEALLGELGLPKAKA